jgi:hypothetical protein
MYKVWLINFGWYLSAEYPTLREAVVYGISKGFEFCVHHDDKVLVAWSPIGGVRILSPSISYEDVGRF